MDLRKCIYLIGATTLNEYQKHIEKEAALERRHQLVMTTESTLMRSVSYLIDVANATGQAVPS